MARNARDKPISTLGFLMMSFFFRIRDKFVSPRKELEKIPVKSGYHVLDYGCGPGSYTIAAAELVGDSGKVHAADIHPLAVKTVVKAASRRGLTNVEVVLTDCETGLESKSIDMVLCLDVFHGLSDHVSILKEFYRVLKPEGVLILDYHHITEEELLTKVNNMGLFKVKEKIDIKYSFTKI
ncbi:MAG: class I SAM-dependent methyltransferase [Candidatus Odinarchaeota archaeon]